MEEEADGGVEFGLKDAVAEVGDAVAAPLVGAAAHEVADVVDDVLVEGEGPGPVAFDGGSGGLALCELEAERVGERAPGRDTWGFALASPFLSVCSDLELRQQGEKGPLFERPRDER